MSKCPFCGSEQAFRVGGEDTRWKCDTYAYQGFGKQELEQSRLCKLIVRNRRLVEIVDRMIEAEKVRTERNYCGHGCPLSEMMIELINERRLSENEVQDDNSNG